MKRIIKKTGMLNGKETGRVTYVVESNDKSRNWFVIACLVLVIAVSFVEFIFSSSTPAALLAIGASVALVLVSWQTALTKFHCVSEFFSLKEAEEEINQDLVEYKEEVVKEYASTTKN